MDKPDDNNELTHALSHSNDERPHAAHAPTHVIPEELRAQRWLDRVQEGQKTQETIDQKLLEAVPHEHRARLYTDLETQHLKNDWRALANDLREKGEKSGWDKTGAD